MICRRCGDDRPEEEFRNSLKYPGLCRPCRKRVSALNWQARFPERKKAHVAVKFALQRGKLQKPEECERCGTETVVVAHHPDYSKPLKVEWLCDKCHMKQTVADNPSRCKPGPRLPVYRPSV